MTVKPIIYLAGPIAGCDDLAANWWRDEVITELSEWYEFRNPMTRDYRKKAFDANALVEADLADIKASNIVLFNCWQTSFGTPMEMVYASKIYGKAVITIRDKPVSPWITYHSVLVVPDLSRAIAFLKKDIWRTYHG